MSKVSWGTLKTGSVLTCIPLLPPLNTHKVAINCRKIATRIDGSLKKAIWNRTSSRNSEKERRLKQFIWAHCPSNSYRWNHENKSRSWKRRLRLPDCQNSVCFRHGLPILLSNWAHFSSDACSSPALLFSLLSMSSVVRWAWSAVSCTLLTSASSSRVESFAIESWAEVCFSWSSRLDTIFLSDVTRVWSSFLSASTWGQRMAVNGQGRNEGCFFTADPISAPTFLILDSKSLTNRPFPSCLLPLFQTESKCEIFHMKMSMICIRMDLWVKLIFIWKVSHLDSFCNRGKRELGNGLLLVPYPTKMVPPDPLSLWKNCWSWSHGLWSLIPGLWPLIPTFWSLIPPLWSLIHIPRYDLEREYVFSQLHATNYHGYEMQLSSFTSSSLALSRYSSITFTS